MKHFTLISPTLFFCLFFIFSFGISKTEPAIKKELPIVVIVTTGGTIAQKIDPKTGGLVPALSGNDIVKAIPGLDSIASITVYDFLNIDSSQMTPIIWSTLSKKVDEILKDPSVCGVVVTHGTDTMVEGAYFLDLTLKSDKPVVFVGAMKDAASLSPDGPINIYNAVLQVASKKSKNFGVTITFNQYINSARDARKIDTTNVHAFDSGKKGFLGQIVNENIYWFRDSYKNFKINLPENLPYVPIIKTFSGDDGKFLRCAVDNGAKAIVVEGLGSGNVPSGVCNAINYALRKNICIALSTTVQSGASYPIYGCPGGGQTLKQKGCIFVGDLPSTKARILLMLALANKMPCKEIENFFFTN